jgi:hypothetical protein
MTKKKATSRRVQASTLKTMSTPPPSGGRRLPRGFNPCNGTQEEEIEALKLVFQLLIGWEQWI